MSELVPSSAFAIQLLAGLIESGVRDVVVCPGSRSQALALAAAEAERAGAIRLHVRTDERSAGFFALGVARETGMPAPVIVTSGTAVANLMPAALEAHEGRVPLLLLTADRPVELRGIRSNQTTRQASLFDAIARLTLDIDVDAVFAEDVGAALAGGEGVDAAFADGAGAAVVGEAEARSRAHDPSTLASRALSAALGRAGSIETGLTGPPGPVQLNLAFREPLSGVGDPPEDVAAVFAQAMRFRVDSQVASTGTFAGAWSDGEHYFTFLPGDDGTESYAHRGDALAVVIAGEGAGGEAEEFARAAGLPLLAEVVSGSRFGREAVTAYASLIDAPELGALIEQAIVFGHPTLTRQVPALLQRDDVETIVVDPYRGPHTEHYDPSGRARVFRSARVADDHEPAQLRRWLGAWIVADRALREQRSTAHEPNLEAARAVGYKERNSYARAEVAALRERVTRELLVESVWRATWPHDRLVLAASRLVRVLDGLAQPRHVEVRANRGLAGIDGTVATALGVAAASQADDNPARAAGVTRVLLGDLALLHDAGSLLLPEAEPRPRIQLFVGNDGGGTIFDTLEAAGTAPRDAFERVMFTPQRAELGALAEAYGWDYARVENRGELDRLLTTPVLGPTLVEVPLAR